MNDEAGDNKKQTAPEICVKMLFLISALYIEKKKMKTINIFSIQVNAL